MLKKILPKMPIITGTIPYFNTCLLSSINWVRLAGRCQLCNVVPTRTKVRQNRPILRKGDRNECKLRNNKEFHGQLVRYTADEQVAKVAYVSGVDKTRQKRTTDSG